MIPVTTITGALGAGKTTVIRSVLSQLAEDYKVVWLKNEYGDVQVDTLLSHESNVQTTEILNGCICCVLVGKLLSALEEIAEKYNPDRVIIETAGTAYSYPIIHEIKKVEKLRHDGLVMVIDALNFKKFEDKSYIARTQSKFVDLVILNKSELINEDKLYKVEDELYDLYLETPKYKAEKGFVPKDLIFGIDAKQLSADSSQDSDLRSQTSDPEHHDHVDDVEVFTFETDKNISQEKIKNMLESLNPEEFYRVKGVLINEEGSVMVNYVLGRTSFEELPNFSGKTRLAFMGKGILSQEESVLHELEK